MPQEVLMEIEEIKKLKARYFRTMDKKLWDQWGEVFTEDATLNVFVSEGESIMWQGREQIVAGNSEALKDSVTVHHGHMPEIELTSDTTASGIWAMFDYVQFPSGTLKGYGHYEEEYVKEDGRWKIKSLKLTRLRVDFTPQE